MRALLHAHSTYSYDGEATLEELCAWGRSRSLDLIFLTEHANDFDQLKMERYVEAIDALDDDRCRLVPGLEVAVRGGFHLLGYNLRRWARVVEPLDTVQFIKDSGGIAVLAHPARYMGRWPDRAALAAMHGIEVWNARYDGRFLPSGAVLDASRSVCARLGNLNFYGGQDLHGLSGGRLVVTSADGQSSIDGFLDALREGNASFGARGLWFPARSGEKCPPQAMLKAGHFSYRLAKRVRDRWFR